MRQLLYRHVSKTLTQRMMKMLVLRMYSLLVDSFLMLHKNAEAHIETSRSRRQQEKKDRETRQTKMTDRSNLMIFESHKI